MSGGNGRQLLVPSPNRSVPHVPYTDERGQRFLEQLRLTGDDVAAAKYADGQNSTVRVYRYHALKDREFRRQVEDAKQEFASKVAGVLRDELFLGVSEPLFNGKTGKIVLDKEGKEIWIKRRQHQIVLAVARKFDKELRDVKTTIVQNQHGETITQDENNPHVLIYANDLACLSPEEIAKFNSIMATIARAKREAFSDMASNESHQSNASDADLIAEFEDVEAKPESLDVVEPSENATEESPIIRKRGRPRKFPMKDVTPMSNEATAVDPWEEVEPQSIEAEGRPIKPVGLDVVEPKRGRPRKVRVNRHYMKPWLTEAKPVAELKADPWEDYNV